MISKELADITAHGDCATVDPELMFPTNHIESRQAKSICLGCGVLEQCREYAIPHASLYGIWGGTTASERQKARRTLK